MVQDLITPDLEKYSLSHLKTKNPLSWTEPDLNELVDAFAAENIAPAILIPFQPNNIKTLLAQSHCRRCGTCCTSNILNRNDPGILVFEEELRQIAKNTTYSYKHLKRLSVKRKSPERDDVRYLPLPCIFYKKGICTIYDIRPFMCKIYPIKDTPPINGKVYITISLRCDYGKEIYKSILKYQKEKMRRQLFDI